MPAGSQPNESEAIIRVKLAGVEEAEATLKRLVTLVEKVGGSVSVNGMPKAFGVEGAGGGGGFMQQAAPPSPLSGGDALQERLAGIDAAASRTTSAIPAGGATASLGGIPAAAAAQSVANVSGGASPAPDMHSQPGGKALDQGGVFTAIVQAEYFKKIAESVSAGAGAAGYTRATGNPFYGSTLLKGAATMAGAGIGTLVAGPVGNIVGGAVGAAIDAFKNPFIEASAEMGATDDLMRHLTGSKQVYSLLNDATTRLKPSGARALLGAGLSGFPMADSMFRRFDYLPDELQGAAVNSMMAARMSPEAVMRYGASTGGDSGGIAESVLVKGMSGANLAERLKAANLLIANEEERQKRAESKDDWLRYPITSTWDRLSDRWDWFWHGKSEDYKRRRTPIDTREAERVRGILQGYQVDYTEAAARLQLSGTQGEIISATLAGYRGTAEGKYELSERAAALEPGRREQTLGLMNKYAAANRALDPKWDPESDNTYLSMRLQVTQSTARELATREAGLRGIFERDVARASLTSTTADIAFQKSVLTGANPASLDWNSLRKGGRESMAALNADRDRRLAIGSWTESDEIGYQSTLAQLKFQTTTGVDIRMEDAKVGGILAESKYDISKISLGYQDSILRGGQKESTMASLNEQQAILDRQKQALKDILDTKKNISYEDRLQLQAQQAALDVQGKQLAQARTWAVAESDFTERWRAGKFPERQAAYDVSIIEGKGGMGMVMGETPGLASARESLAGRQAEYASLLKAGQDPNSKAMRDLSDLIQSLKVDVARSKLASATVPMSAASGLAMDQAGYTINMNQLLTGADSAEAVRRQMAVNTEQIAAQRAQKAAFIAKNGAGEWTDAMERANQAQILGLGVQNAQLQRQLTVPATPPGEKIAASDLATKIAVGQMTYTTEQDMRGSLQSMMGLIGSQLSRLNERKQENIKSGTWSEQQEVEFAERKNQLVLQAAQLQQQLEQGWTDRLISQAYNMPGNGRYITSQFTHREAAMFAGIYHMAFGGTKEQMDYARGSFRRIIGPGGPGGLVENVLAGKRPGTVSPDQLAESITGKGKASASGRTKAESTKAMQAAINGGKTGRIEGANEPRTVGPSDERPGGPWPYLEERHDPSGYGSYSYHVGELRDAKTGKRADQSQYPEWMRFAEDFDVNGRAVLMNGEGQVEQAIRNWNIQSAYRNRLQPELDDMASFRKEWEKGLGPFRVVDKYGHSGGGAEYTHEDLERSFQAAWSARKKSAASVGARQTASSVAKVDNPDRSMSTSGQSQAGTGSGKPFTIHIIVDLKNEKGQALRHIDKYLNAQQAGSNFQSNVTQSTQ